MEKPVTIGIPRAMLYYRFKTLWQTFFEELGVKTIVSKPTSKLTLEEGSAIAIDETCLSFKIFMGHVKSLIGNCDYILIPRVSNYGLKYEMCTRFESMYDLTRNLFRGSSQKFISYNIDHLQKKEEKSGLVGLGQQLGFSAKEAKKAYDKAKKEEQRKRKADQKKQEQNFRSEKSKILVVAHDYLGRDAYIGKTVTDFLRSCDIVPVRADLVDRDEAMKVSREFSPTCKWLVNRELLGSIVLWKDKVDGIILLSAFPCGPDSMVNELITRKIKDVPILNLVMDGQNGTAGVETRLESFVDIIRFKEGKL